jgi:hypothetical protein
VLDAVAFDPADAEAFFRRAMTSAALREYDSAIADYDRVIGLMAARQRGAQARRRRPHGGPSSQPSGCVALRGRLSMGERDAAIADFNEALRIDPKVGPLLAR